MPMTKAEIVEGMLSVLDSPEHWCKHRLFDHHQAHCLLGALNRTICGSSLDGWTWYETNTAGKAVLVEMDKLAIERGYKACGYGDLLGRGAHVVAFNNAVEIEYEDVRLFLKEVLVRVEED